MYELEDNPTSKIISNIINKSLSDYISKRLMNKQFSYRVHRLCVDHVNTLTIIAKHAVEDPLYLCFIDFAKAFGTTDQSQILSNAEEFLEN